MLVCFQALAPVASKFRFSPLTLSADLLRRWLNFTKSYCLAVDAWAVYHNSGDAPILIESSPRKRQRRKSNLASSLPLSDARSSARPASRGRPPACTAHPSTFRRAEGLWRKNREALRMKKPVRSIRREASKRAHIPSGEDCPPSTLTDC